MATITFSTTSNDTFGYGGTDASAALRVAAKFTADQNIGSCDVYTSTVKVNSPSDNVVFSIQADAAGIPSGTDLGTTVSVVGSTLPTSAAAATLKGTITGLTLVNGLSYWLVQKRSGSQDTTNQYSAPIQITQAGQTLGTINTSELPVSWEIHADWGLRGSLITYAPTAVNSSFFMMFR